MDDNPVVIIGAGPAGLAAGYELINRKVRPVVLEKDNIVGGIARTESYKEFFFDIGGHRFFTKNEEIFNLWKDLLGEDFLRVNRLSRIFYRGKYFNYPLRPANALLNLGFLESLQILTSYCRARLSPSPEENSFDEWIINRFGERLYRTFFKTYTEKVWGIPCSEIQADWAAQRIKGLSLMVALANALFGGQQTKSLIEQFHYPRFGPGMMWNRFKDRIVAEKGEVLLNTEVSAIHHSNDMITAVEYTSGKTTDRLTPVHCISSLPISKLVQLFRPQPPAEVLEAANRLSYRAFIIVVLIIDLPELFPDQWLYVHSPHVKVGRIQNFKNWSNSMVPDQNTTSIGMEYFCNENDETWNMEDADLVKNATREMVKLGLAEAALVSDSYVVRQSHAYPVYDSDYKKNLQVLRNFLENYRNLQTIGRSGMHRYNNMDHSMQTGILAAKNCTGGGSHDLWAINEEKSYLEEDKRIKKTPVVPEKVLLGTFARMDKLAFATAVGSICGMLVLAATLWIISRGGDVLSSHLRLLGQYFIGYTVSVKGGFIAFGYSFFWGFLIGWLFAYLRNLFLAIYIYNVKRKIELLSLKDFFDNF